MVEDIKKNIASNLVLLRKQNKMTQQDVAKITNYSDKAVSRWELGDSFPDIDVLSSLCDYFGVTFEWLIKSHNEAPKISKIQKEKFKIASVILWEICCFTLATILYVFFLITKNISCWPFFICAGFFSALIFSFAARRWWGNLVCFTANSISLWLLISSSYLSILEFGNENLWPLFLVGIPIQSILILLLYIKNGKN